MCVSVSIQRIISKHYWIKKALKKSHLLCMGGKKRSIVTAYTSFSTWKLGSQYCNCKGVCAVHIVIIWLNRGELSTKEYLGTPGRVSVLNLPQWLKILQHIQQIKKKKSCSVQRPLQPQIITHNLFAFLTVNQIFNVWIYLWYLISFFFFLVRL